MGPHPPLQFTLRGKDIIQFAQATCVSSPCGPGSQYMWTSSSSPSLSMPHEAVKERRHLRTRTQLRRPVIAAFYWCNGLQFERSGIAVSLFVQWTQNRWAWHAIDISSASSYFLTSTKVAPTTLKRYYKICYGYRIKHNVSTKARDKHHD